MARINSSAFIAAASMVIRRGCDVLRSLQFEAKLRAQASYGTKG
jgi:hypothetical protein